MQTLERPTTGHTCHAQRPHSVVARPVPRHPQVRVIGQVEMRQAILDLLNDAQINWMFTSLYAPVWTGWVTAMAVASHLGSDIVERVWDDAIDEGTRSLGWYYVESTMLAMVQSRNLEKRLCYPLQHSLHPEARNITDIEYRLPGSVGYCRVYPGRPLGDGDESDEEVVSNAKSITSRQIRQINAELAEMGSEMPPYLLARFEQAKKTKSGLRALR